MAKNTTSTKLPTLELIILLISLFYMQSVLTVAHHISHMAHNQNAWTHIGPPQTVEPAAFAWLIIGLSLCAYSWRYKKQQPSTLIIVSLTIFATASIFWLSGLRANFYF